MLDPSDFMTNNPQVLFALVRACADINGMLARREMDKVVEYAATLDPLVRKAFWVKLVANWHDAVEAVAAVDRMLAVCGVDLHHELEQTFIKPMKAHIQTIAQTLEPLIRDRLDNLDQPWNPEHLPAKEPPITESQWDIVKNLLDREGLGGLFKEE